MSLSVDGPSKTDAGQGCRRCTVTSAAWHQKKSWALNATRDHNINPDLERSMAKRAGANRTRGESVGSVTTCRSPTFHRENASFQFAKAGPTNSASMLISMESPTPTVVPGAGIPIVMPNSERLKEPCAEKPIRALGSIRAIPA